MVKRDQILNQLKAVIDPELNINIVDLGLVYDVSISEKTGEVTIIMTLTTPGCPLSAIFEDVVPDAVRKIDGVKRVKIDLVWEPPWTPEKMSDDAKEELGIIQ